MQYTVHATDTTLAHIDPSPTYLGRYKSLKHLAMVVEDNTLEPNIRGMRRSHAYIGTCTYLHILKYAYIGVGQVGQMMHAYTYTYTYKHTVRSVLEVPQHIL